LMQAALAIARVLVPPQRDLLWTTLLTTGVIDLALSGGVAAVVFVLIEKPAIDLGRTGLRRTPSPDSA
jgi:peptidoglycan/LPS O-acetylase OafA/YrhL